MVLVMLINDKKKKGLIINIEILEFEWYIFYVLLRKRLK